MAGKRGITLIKHQDKENEYCRSSVEFTIHDPDITWPEEVRNVLQAIGYIVPDGCWTSEEELDAIAAENADVSFRFLVEDLIKQGKQNELLAHPDGIIREMAKSILKKEDK